MARGRVVFVSGPIGSGKSTTTFALGRELGLAPLIERHDRNPFLVRFYRHPKRWAVLSQLFFLIDAHLSERRARRLGGIVEGSVVDVHFAFNRTLRENGVLGDFGIVIVSAVYRVLRYRGVEPDLVILLQAPGDVLVDRIRKRGRVAERGITSGYLEQLSAGPASYWPHRLGDACVLVDT